MKIEWEKVKELSDGHGVLFIPATIDKPIAFLLGYEWFHGEPDKVTVEILQDDCLFKENISLDINNIIDETNRSIRLFIKSKGLRGCGSREAKVRVWYNA